jgi:hypothetical protein
MIDLLAFTTVSAFVVRPPVDTHHLWRLTIDGFTLTLFPLEILETAFL